MSFGPNGLDRWKSLVAHPTPTNLAAAAFLAESGDLIGRRPLELIAQAEALAPQRAELAWVHLAICERLKCERLRFIVSVIPRPSSALSME